MRPLGGMRRLSPEEVLALRAVKGHYAAGGRLEGHAGQSLLAERTNASCIDPALLEEARRRLAAAAAAERRTAKKRAQRLRRAARGGDARAKVRLKLLRAPAAWC